MEIWNKSNTKRMPRREAQWEQGRRDRELGYPCSSANGDYLDGWYSITNPERKNCDETKPS